MVIRRDLNPAFRTPSDFPCVTLHSVRERCLSVTRLAPHGGVVLEPKGNFPWETLKQTFPFFQRIIRISTIQRVQKGAASKRKTAPHSPHGYALYQQASTLPSSVQVEDRDTQGSRGARTINT